MQLYFAIGALVAFTTTTATAAAVVQGGNRIIDFDDIYLSNEVTCVTKSLTDPYKDFLITGNPSASGSSAIVYNTTSTQFCHEHSSGAGPWRKATSQPNVLYGPGGQVVFTHTSRDFVPVSISVISHFSREVSALDPTAKIKVTLTGKSPNGRVTDAITSIHTGTGPWTVNTFQGWKKIRTLVIQNDWVYLNGSVPSTLWAQAWADSFEYRL